MAPAERTTERINKDPRVDRLVSWSLNLASCLALSVGAWLFNDLKSEIASLRNSIDDSTKAISKLEVQNALNARLQQVVEEIQQQLAVHVQRDGHGVALSRISALEESVRELKRKSP